MTSDEAGGAIARAEALMQTSRPQDAVRVLREALVHRPDDSDLLGALAEALVAVRDLEAALATADRAVAAAPTSSSAHAIRSRVLLAMDRPGDARAAAREALALDPDDLAALACLAHGHLRMHQANHAREVANQMLERAPTWTGAYQLHGLISLEMGAWAEAETWLRRGLELAPDSPAMLNNLGVALQGQGRSVEASDLFARAGALEARDDLFRENALVAAADHLNNRPVEPGEQIMTPGVWLVVLLGARAGSRSLAPHVVGAILVGVIVTAIAFTLVRRRLRLRHLPPMVQQVVRQQRRTDRERWLHITRWTRRNWIGAGLAALALVVLASAFMVTDESADANESTTRPDAPGTRSPVGSAGVDPFPPPLPQTLATVPAEQLGSVCRLFSRFGDGAPDINGEPFEVACADFLDE